MISSWVRLLDEAGTMCLSLEGFLSDADAGEIRRSVRDALARVSSEPVTVDLEKALWIPDKCVEELRRAGDELRRRGAGIRLVNASSDIAAWLTVKEIVPALPYQFSAPLKGADDLRLDFFVGEERPLAVIDDDDDSYERMAAPLLARGFGVRRIPREPKLTEIIGIVAAVASLDLRRDDPFNALALLRDLRIPVLAVTASADPMLREKAGLLGAGAITSRPSPKNELLAFVKSLLRRAVTPQADSTTTAMCSGHSTDERPRKKALVIDDSGFVRRQMAQFLEPAFEIVAKKDGVEGLAALTGIEPVVPDVIFLDVEMPRLNGLQLLRRLRETESLKNIPVVMISGVRERNKIVEAMKCGVKDFIMKPVTREQLLFRLERLFSSWTGSADAPSVREDNS